MDGTKEFIKKNGEFTVNIALIKNNKPHLGIVYCPVKKILYWNDNDKKVFKREKEETNRYADHYVIQFPNDEDLASDQTPEDKSAGGEEPAVANPHKQGIDTKYVSGKTMIDAMLRNVNEEGKRNGIGNSQVVYDTLLDMNQVHKPPKEKEFKPVDTRIEVNVNNNVNEKAISFPEGTSINKIIEEVILSSLWATQNGAHGQDDKYGYKDWFKIECKVYPVHVPGTTSIRAALGFNEPEMFIESFYYKKPIKKSNKKRI